MQCPPAASKLWAKALMFGAEDGYFYPLAVWSAG